MNDNSPELPKDFQAQLEATARSAFELHTQELRRSLDISVGFYDKLSALSAGSIAVAASIGVAILAKSSSVSPSLRAISHWLLAIVLCLWVSLVCSVGHNFGVVVIAKFDVSYSQADFVRTMLKRGFELVLTVLPGVGQSEITRLEEAAQADSLKIQKRNVAITGWLRPLSSGLGYTSIVAFLTAYTLIAICILQRVR